MFPHLFLTFIRTEIKLKLEQDNSEFNPCNMLDKESRISTITINKLKLLNICSKMENIYFFKLFMTLFSEETNNFTFTYDF